MPVGEPLQTNQPEPLESAVETCREALAHYRAGFLDDDEIRRILIGAGLALAAVEPSVASAPERRA